MIGRGHPRRAYDHHVARLMIGILALGGLTGCADQPGDAPSSAPPSDDRAATAATTGPGAAELDAAARDVVAFLRSDAPADDIRLADTVTLHLAPEGGGDRVALPRERLRDRDGWAVRSGGFGSTYTFVPPAGLTELTTAVGRHMRCFDQPLSAVAEELAGLPHVGTRLAPPHMESCLQTWNLTLVFAPTAGPPTLVAAIYDQWEW